MEKYMIGDEFGHMWYEESEEFFCEKGTLYDFKYIAEKRIEELSKLKEYSKCDWKFKIWTVCIKS